MRQNAIHQHHPAIPSRFSQQNLQQHRVSDDNSVRGGGQHHTFEGLQEEDEDNCIDTGEPTDLHQEPALEDSGAEENEEDEDNDGEDSDGFS